MPWSASSSWSIRAYATSPAKEMPTPARSGFGLIAAPPVVKRIVPRPASRIGSRTAWVAATAPRMLNSSGPRRSSTDVSSSGLMNSPAGSGEYSSTSTGPRRAARSRMAATSASLSRMSAAAPAAVMPWDSSSAARSSSLDWVRETSPTEKPSRPKRRATAMPRLGPAPTITIDMSADDAQDEPGDDRQDAEQDACGRRRGRGALGRVVVGRGGGDRRGAEREGQRAPEDRAGHDRADAEAENGGRPVLARQPRHRHEQEHRGHRDAEQGQADPAADRGVLVAAEQDRVGEQLGDEDHDRGPDQQVRPGRARERGHAPEFGALSVAPASRPSQPQRGIDAPGATTVPCGE